MAFAELGIIAGFAAVVLLFWSPLLAVKRLRDLFRWPTRWFVANYLLLGSGLIVGQCLSYLAVALLVAGTGPITGGDAAGIVVGVLAVNVFLPSIGVFAALRFSSANGDRTAEAAGRSGRIALAFGIVWYAVVASGTFVLGSLAIMFANLPT
ncbi:hypothetical protein [Natrinema versiforme]|uniref:DUF8162 domain-containing protein n=1 Tax=Natrinema versiforme JCM 10478 TaxID=1227496 RepID=L9XN11_9EURY|nr:hypothetical protein [Natrinema versiforme]ELY63125.1 hypothetical protein C489_19956 [Natrinema versiforme JCM 10478]